MPAATAAAAARINAARRRMSYTAELPSRPVSNQAGELPPPGRTYRIQRRGRLQRGRRSSRPSAVTGTSRSASGTTPDPDVCDCLARRTNTLVAAVNNDAASPGRATTRGGIPNRERQVHPRPQRNRMSIDIAVAHKQGPDRRLPGAEPWVARPGGLGGARLAQPGMATGAGHFRGVVPGDFYFLLTTNARAT
jgi:hypothetical protein